MEAQKGYPLQLSDKQREAVNNISNYVFKMFHKTAETDPPVDPKAVEKELINRLENDPLSIKDIPNPNENMQLFAVFQDTRAILHIKEPTETTLLLAITESPNILKDLNEIPNDEIILKAIQDQPHAHILDQLNEPSKQLQLAAVAENGLLLSQIESPDREVIKAAINNNSEAIKYVTQPDEELQLAAVKKDKGAAQFIEKPVDNLMDKSGWVIYNRDNDPNKPDINKLPDGFAVKVKDQAEDSNKYWTVNIHLTPEAKVELLQHKSVWLGSDKGPGFEISGGEAFLNLDKDGGLTFNKSTVVVEGGAVNQYRSETPVNLSDCYFNKSQEKGIEHKRSFDIQPEDFSLSK